MIIAANDFFTEESGGYLHTEALQGAKTFYVHPCHADEKIMHAQIRCQTAQLES